MAQSKLILTPEEFRQAKAQGLIAPPAATMNAHHADTIRAQIPPPPRALQEDLAVNQHMIPRYKAAVQRALETSFACPETAVRMMSASVLSERVELCHNFIVLMRRQKGWTLRKCFDILPEALVGALAAGRRPEDYAVDAHDRGDRSPQPEGSECRGEMYVPDGGKPQVVSLDRGVQDMREENTDEE